MGAVRMETGVARRRPVVLLRRPRRYTGHLFVFLLHLFFNLLVGYKSPTAFH